MECILSLLKSIFLDWARNAVEPNLDGQSEVIMTFHNSLIIVCQEFPTYTGY